MTHATKENGEWIEKTPSQFRQERNASIPDARLEAEGLFEVETDPRPDAPEKIVEPGPIIEREGRPYQSWTTRDPTPEELERERQRLTRAAHRAYSKTVQQVSQGYPPEEREGWAEQTEAAKEVLAGGRNDLIDALRAPTGETATEMAQNIIDKRSQYLEVYGRVTARRRELDAQISAATTLGELASIDVTAGW